MRDGSSSRSSRLVFRCTSTSSLRQYIDLMGNNPSFGYNADSGELAADLPVDSVTWEEAREYCRRFNERELKAGRVPPGYEYRLPTEGE